MRVSGDKRAAMIAYFATAAVDGGRWFRAARFT
jgi:hypothetical protein